MSADFSSRWAWAEVHTGLIQHNVAIVAERVAPAKVWAVVKANAYGHGAIPVANAALNAGAEGLCVALMDEGVALRRAGITAPILVLSEQPAELSELLVGYELTATVTTTRGVAVLANAASAAAGHLDQGRVGRTGSGHSDLDGCVVTWNTKTERGGDSSA